MSSAADGKKTPQSRSTFDAVIEYSNVTEQRRSRNASRNASFNRPPPHFMASMAAPSPSTTVVPPPSRPPAESPHQNSSDELDGYRSSCEGSVAEELGQSLEKDRTRTVEEGSSHRGSPAGPPPLSPQSLTAATAAKGEAAAMHSSTAAEWSARGRSPAAAKSPRTGGPGRPPHSPLPSSSSTSHVQLPGSSRPRLSLGNAAAREEERQRLIAMSPLTTTAAVAAAPTSEMSASAPAVLPAVTTTTATAPTPISLAEASAADSDEGSSTELPDAAPTSVYATASVKTSEAMLSVALESDARPKAEKKEKGVEEASSERDTVTRAANSRNHSAHTILREEGTKDSDEVPEHAKTTVLMSAPLPPLEARAAAQSTERSRSSSQRTRTPVQHHHTSGSNPGTANATASVSPATAPNPTYSPPPPSTLSRLSRSSSNDSSAVEASMDYAVPLNNSSIAGTGQTSQSNDGAANTSSAEPRATAASPDRRSGKAPRDLAEESESSAEGNGESDKGTAFTGVGSAGVSPVPPVPAAAVVEVPAAAPVMVPVPLAADTPVINIVSASPIMAPSQKPSSRTGSAEASAGLAPSIVVVGSPADRAKEVTFVGDVATYTGSNRIAPHGTPSLSHGSPDRNLAAASAANKLLPSTVDVSSSSSIGGHHLSVTEGNAFLKQSGSRREEAFYNMIQPYQETLVREAVRQAPHTVEHWKHQNASTKGSGRSGGAIGGNTGISEEHTAANTNSSNDNHNHNSSVVTSGQATMIASPATANVPSVPSSASATGSFAHQLHIEVNGSMDSVLVFSPPSQQSEGAFTIRDARWEAYQQLEAEDMSALDILASAPPATAEEAVEHCRCPSALAPSCEGSAGTVVATSPVMTRAPSDPFEGNLTTSSSPSSPMHRIDKTLVEFAARLWWTVRFRHFNRSSATAYEVQRQAAESASMSPFSFQEQQQPRQQLSASSATSSLQPNNADAMSRGNTPDPHTRATASPSPIPAAGKEGANGAAVAGAAGHRPLNTPPMPPSTAGSASVPFLVAVQPPSNSSDKSSTPVIAPVGSVAVSVMASSGTTTPPTMGSFAAVNLDDPANTNAAAAAANINSNVNTNNNNSSSVNSTHAEHGSPTVAPVADRQYLAQKHRALQLLAAFVPRYHGTRRLFVRDVLRCERRGVAAAIAACNTRGNTPASTSNGNGRKINTSPSNAAVGARDEQNPMADGEDASAAATTALAPIPGPQQPKIEDADNDDESDGAEADFGSKKVCRMIMLEYVCYKFRRPCVMDIKMGSRQYGLHPTPEKKCSKERKAKLSTSGRYGIRLAGYRRWNAAASRYDFRGKLQCRSLTLNEVKEEISTFLLSNRELERVFRRQLQRLRVAFSQQTVFRFYTSSLLFVYDAEDPLPTARVTMVDFAYTYESKELIQGGDPDADFAYDIGYLKAIDTLLSLLA